METVAGILFRARNHRVWKEREGGLLSCSPFVGEQLRANGTHGLPALSLRFTA